MNEKDLLRLIKDRKSSRWPFDENRPIDPAILQTSSKRRHGNARGRAAS